MEPQINADERRLNQITETIIGCAYDIGNGLGCGFLEKVYENALMVSLTHAGPKAQQQCPIVVRWKRVVVGEYFADLLVEGSVIVEIKAAKGIDEIHTAQCLNYLKASGIRVCLLINFAKPKVEIKRIVREF